MATLLIVDDDDDVRELAVAILEEEGYTIVAAPDAQHALRIIEDNPDIRLLFTDVVMPGMDGFELAAEARRRRPDLRVVFTSGFVKNLPASVAEFSQRPFISKPWNTRALRATLREAWGCC